MRNYFSALLFIIAACLGITESRCQTNDTAMRQSLNIVTDSTSTAEKIDGTDVIYNFENQTNKHVTVLANGLLVQEVYYESGEMKSKCYGNLIVSTDSIYTYHDKRPVLIISQKITWLKNGTYKEWNLDGSIKTIGYYIHNKEAGVWRYYEDGEEITEVKEIK